MSSGKMKSTGQAGSDQASDPISSGLSRRFGWVRLLDWLKHPECFFLAVSFPLGLVMLFLTPPIQSPDEDYHFFRAYQISEGQLIAIKRGDETGGNLPAALARFVARYQRIPFFQDEKISRHEILESASVQLDPSERQFLGYSAIAVQPPLGHAPQAVGLLLSRQLTSSVLIGMYAGRLLNLFATIGVLFLAIRRTPVCRWGFAALSLTPMSMFLIASLSSDALTNALAFLFVAEIFRCAFGPDERISMANVGILAILGGVVGGLVKQAYFPLAVCYLLIPMSKLGSIRRYFGGFVLVMGVSLISTAIWAFVVRDIYSPARLTQGIVPKEQFRLIVTDPNYYVTTICSTSFYQFKTKLKEFLGVLGWLDLSLPSKARTLEWISLAVLFLAEFHSQFRLKIRQILLSTGIALLICVMVMTALHLTWNPVGFPYVRFQGRYFIPVGPLFGIAFSQLAMWFPTTVTRFIPRLRPMAIAYVPCFLLVATWCVYDRYYVETPETIASRHVRFAISQLENGKSLDDARPGLQEALQLIPREKRCEDRRALAAGLLQSGNSAEAIEWMLTNRLRGEKGDAEVYMTAGKIHTAEGDYTDALACFEKADRNQPGSEFTAFMLWGVRDLSAKLEKLNRAMSSQVKLARLDQHESDVADHLPDIHSRVVTVSAETGQRMRGSNDFFWRPAPPCGNPNGEQTDHQGVPRELRGGSFYACATTLCTLACSATMDKPFPTVVGKRVFLFPPPLNAVLLNDDQVSWYYQRRMIDLNPEETQRELDYRAEHRLTFPITELPQ